MSSAHRNRGFSVVELMIAITLGLMVVGFVATIFLSGNRNYAQDERFARMQENGRYTLNRLTEELSNVEFWGGMTNDSPTNAGIRDYTTPATVLATGDCGVDFTIGSSTRALGNVTASTANTTFSCINAATFRNGTDVLLVQKVLSPPATPGMASANPFNPQKAYLRTNTQTGVLIKAGSAPTDLTSTFTIPNQSWMYWEYAPTVYYVQDTGIPALHRLYLGSGLTMQDEKLVDGVEAFHVLFGVDTDLDGVANQYKANPTPAELKNAINARVYVLVRSVDNEPGYTDDKKYWLGDICYSVAGGNCNTLTDASATAAPQRYHRRVFTSTVALRNPAFRARLAQ